MGTAIKHPVADPVKPSSVTEPRGGLGGTYPPLFENMGLVISPNLQTSAYGACERPPVSPDLRVPPHLQTPGSVTGRHL